MKMKKKRVRIILILFIVAVVFVLVNLIKGTLKEKILTAISNNNKRIFKKKYPDFWVILQDRISKGKIEDYSREELKKAGNEAGGLLGGMLFDYQGEKAKNLMKIIDDEFLTVSLEDLKEWGFKMPFGLPKYEIFLM